MVGFPKCKSLFRFIALLTLLGFAPSSICVWNLAPEAFMVAHAEVVKGEAAPDAVTAEAPAVPAVAPTTTAMLTPLSDEQLKSIAVKPPAPKVEPTLLARVSHRLPNPDDAVADLNLSPEKAASPERIKLALATIGPREQRGPLGPAESASALDSADSLRSGGNYSDAAMAYIQIMDQYPETNEALWADSGLRKILHAVNAGELSKSTVSAFESASLKYAAQTVHGKYAVMVYHAERAMSENQQGSTASARVYAQRAQSLSLALLQQYPSHYLQIAVSQDYLEMAEVLGDQGLASAFTNLTALTNELPASMARLGAHAALAQYWIKHGNHLGAITLHSTDLLNELSAGYVDQILNDGTVPYWVKGNIGLEIGNALMNLGKYEQALQRFQDTLKLGRGKGQMSAMLGYKAATCTELLHPMNPEIGTQAFLDFLKDPGNSYLADAAVWKLGNIYFLASDYRGAVDYYSRVVKDYPKSDYARMAQNEIAYIMENLYESAPAYAKRETQNQQYAQLCGPKSLHTLLESMGVASTVEELAKLAQTDDGGTTMLALVNAAKAKGVALTGVSAPDARQLALPCIVFVNQNHFVALKEVRDDAVVISDPNKDGERLLTMSEFTGMWDGKALVSSVGMTRKLELAALETAKGGWLPGHTNAKPVPISSGPGAPLANTAVRSPGVNPNINLFETSLAMTETDEAVTCLGDLGLSFTRVYFNEKGYHRGEYTGGNVWQNNIGSGWTHNLNMHLAASTGTPPTSVVFYDETGTPRTYDYSSTSGGYDYFYRSSTGQTEERGYTLKRNTSTLKYTLLLPNDMRYEFSAATTDAYRFARLESIYDKSSNAVSFSYDGAVGTGKLTKVASPSGDAQHLLLSYSGNQITKVEFKTNATVVQTTNYAYASGELTKVTDNDTKTVQYAYGTDNAQNQSRFINSITDKAGVTSSFAWTFAFNAGYAEAQKIVMTAPNGLTQSFDRSVSTSVDTQTNKDGATVLSKAVSTPVTGDASRKLYADSYEDTTNYDRYGFQYDANGDKTKDTQPDGATVATYSYNTVGSILTKATNLGETVSFSYADGIHPTKVIDPAGLESTVYYDTSNRATKAVTPSSGNNGIQYTYDSNGQVISLTNPSSGLTTFKYDSQGQITSTKDPLNNETKCEYDCLGNVTRIIDPGNRSTFCYYATGSCACGATGQLTKVKNALNDETTRTYDSNGHQTTGTNALGQTTSYSYDPMGNLTRVESPSNSGTYFLMSYDMEGHNTAQTDCDGRTTTIYYDFQGRKTMETDVVGNYVQYGYDTLGNLTLVTDAAGGQTGFYYDGVGRLTKSSYPGGKTINYCFDSVGRVTKIGAGANGSVDPVQYYYESTTGLMSKVRYYSGANSYDANYEYDDARQLTRLTDWMDATNGLKYAYDLMGRLTRLTDYDTTHLDYTYDASGNVVTMSGYHGAMIVYQYTGTNRLSTITAPGGKTWTYTYNALGRLTQLSTPNGMTTNYTYDGRDRLTKIQHKDGATVADGFTYALDAHGNITTTTYQDNAYWSYLYDGRHRLTKAERYNSSSTLLKRYMYTYSGADNMLTKQVYTPPSTTDTYVYAYTTANELTKQTLAGTDTNFAYDAWGRLTSKTQGGYSAAYYYNYGDKLTKVSSNFPGEGTVTYRVGADGKRRERYDGATTAYNWDAGRCVIEEEDSSGTLTNTYIHDLSRPIGTILAEVIGSSPSSGSFHYYFQDNVGSTRRLRDGSKASLAQYEYDPFGGDYLAIDATTRHKFTGHNWDAVAQLFYTPYRYFSPAISRWTSRDPKGFIDGPNMFEYSHENPIRFYDLLGSDIFIEGPSGDEGQWHQSLCIGNPFGDYHCFSFGLDTAYGYGHVYEDGGSNPLDYGSKGGKIERYMKTNVFMDKCAYKRIVNEWYQPGGLNTAVGRWYGINTCRTWSNERYDELQAEFHRQDSSPPARKPVSRSMLRQVLSTFAPTNGTTTCSTATTRPSTR